jgi:hypothetical protein
MRGEAIVAVVAVGNAATGALGVGAATPPGGVRDFLESPQDTQRVMVAIAPRRSPFPTACSPVLVRRCQPKRKSLTASRYQRRRPGRC